MRELTYFGGEGSATLEREWWELRGQFQSTTHNVRSWKRAKPQGPGCTYCSDCGNRVKIFVSPRRNPHSNKLGRAVTMKDHDLCRRCWRRLLQRQQQKGIIPIEYGRHQGFDFVLMQEQVSAQPQYFKTAS